jgi:hypothetical protein
MLMSDLGRLNVLERQREKHGKESMNMVWSGISLSWQSLEAIFLN